MALSDAQFDGATEVKWKFLNQIDDLEQLRELVLTQLENFPESIDINLIKFDQAIAQMQEVAAQFKVTCIHPDRG